MKLLLQLEDTSKLKIRIFRSILFSIIASLISIYSFYHSVTKKQDIPFQNGTISASEIENLIKNHKTTFKLLEGNFKDTITIDTNSNDKTMSNLYDRIIATEAKVEFLTTVMANQNTSYKVYTFYAIVSIIAAAIGGVFATLSSNLIAQRKESKNINKH